MRITYVNRLFLRFRGQTIPPFGIFILQSEQYNLSLLAHEIGHWLQYRRMGLLLFYSRYFYQWLTHGYKAMPMELECRQPDFFETGYPEYLQ